MIGAQFLFWGTEGQSTYNPFFKSLWAWNFGGSTGHAAIRLVLPASYKAIVKQYCSSKDNPQLIPHFHAKQERPKDVESTEDVIIVYFSIWPSNRLKFEYQDRISSVYGVKGQTAPNLVLDPTQLPLGRKKRESAKTDWSRIERLQSMVDFLHSEAEKHYEDYEYLDLLITVMLLKQELQDSDEQMKEARRQLEAVKQKLSVLHNKLEPVEYKLNVLLDGYFKKYMPDFGQPDSIVTIPLESDFDYGINPALVLKEMRSLIDNEFDFDFYWNNCSHHTRMPLLNGISPVLRQELVSGGLMSRYGLLPALIDAPVRVLYTVEQIAKGIEALNLSEDKDQVQEIDSTLCQPSTYLPSLQLNRVIQRDEQSTEHVPDERSHLRHTK